MINSKSVAKALHFPVNGLHWQKQALAGTVTASAIRPGLVQERCFNVTLPVIP